MNTLLLRLIAAGVLIYIVPKCFPNMSPLVKVISWAVGSIVALYAFIDAVRGFWSMYKEYGPGIHSVAYHWWEGSPFRATLSIAIIGAVIVGGGFYLWASHEPTPELPTKSKTPAQNLSEKKIPDPLLASQLQEIQELEAFIGGKDEGQLLELFDFPNMTRFNIVRAKACLNALSESEAAECNAFFAQGGQGYVNLAYGASITRSAGGIIYHDNPKRLNILNTSAKYVRAREALTKFQNSSRLPPKVKEAVGDLIGAAAQNIQLLHEVINEEIEKHPEHILHESDPDSQSFGGASGRFLDRRVWLEPKQKAIIGAIDEYLKSL